MSGGTCLSSIEPSLTGVCSTWPALWEVGADWPNQGRSRSHAKRAELGARDSNVSTGEIDVLEGVNDVSPNQSTLHTSSGK